MSEDLRTKIDWNALDEHWKDEYEADYGQQSIDVKTIIKHDCP